MKDQKILAHRADWRNTGWVKEGKFAGPQFRMQIQWVPHSSDTKEQEATLEAETIDDLALKFAGFLKEKIFAEWGYYSHIYYPDIRSTVSYLGLRLRERGHI